MIQYHIKYDGDTITNNSGTDYVKAPSNTHVLSFPSLLFFYES